MAFKTRVALNQFNNGLVSPEMESRADLQLYPYSCRTVQNAVLTAFGGVKRRGGTAYVAQTRNNLPAVLIPFKLNENVAYILEFTDYAMRVYKNHALLCLADQTPYEILTPYSIDQLTGAKGKKVSYLQIGDVLYFAHETTPLQKLSRYGDYDWRFEQVNLKGGPWCRLNADTEKMMSVAGTSGTVTITSSAGGVIEIDHPSWGPWLATENVGYGGSIDGVAVEIYFEDTLLCRYSRGDKHNQNNYNEYIVKAINSVQCGIRADVLGAGYSAIKLADTTLERRYSEKSIKLRCWRHRTDGRDDGWQETTWTFGSESNFSAFSLADEGRLIRLTMQNEGVEYWYQGRTEVKAGDILKSDGKFYEAISEGTCGSVKPTHSEGSESDGKISWKYLHSGYGWGVITQFVSENQVKVYVHENFPKELDKGTYKWELGVLGQGGVYASGLRYFKDRLVLLMDTQEGPAALFGKTGDYENFEDLTFGEVLDDNAFNLYFLTELNTLSWAAVQDYLYIGTQGSVLEVRPQTTSEAFGPTNVAYDIICLIGSPAQRPVLLGSSLLFLGAKGKAMYDLAYRSDTDRYEPEELSLLAQNYLARGIKDWDLQYEPDRLIWTILNDGSLLGLTYNKTQNVRAFHRHTTQGTFESLAVIPAPDGQIDDVWFVVKRHINGQDVYNVEYLRPPLPLDVPAEYNEDKTSLYNLTYAWCLDCAKQFKVKSPTVLIEGLEHLEGAQVEGLADGVPFKNKQVLNGQITLDKPASVITVGLPYLTVFEPMPLNLDANSSGQAKSYRINQIIARVLNSAQFLYQAENKHIYTARLRNGQDKTERTLLKSGDIKIAWPGNNTAVFVTTKQTPNTTAPRVVLKMQEPLPWHLLALFIDVEVASD